MQIKTDGFNENPQNSAYLTELKIYLNIKNQISSTKEWCCEHAPVEFHFAPTRNFSMSWMPSLSIKRMVKEGRFRINRLLSYKTEYIIKKNSHISAWGGERAINSEKWLKWFKRCTEVNFTSLAQAAVHTTRNRSTIEHCHGKEKWQEWVNEFTSSKHIFRRSSASSRVISAHRATGMFNITLLSLIKTGTDGTISLFSTQRKQVHFLVRAPRFQTVWSILTTKDIGSETEQLNTVVGLTTGQMAKSVWAWY